MTKWELIYDELLQHKKYISSFNDNLFTASTSDYSPINQTLSYFKYNMQLGTRKKKERNILSRKRLIHGKSDNYHFVTFITIS